jgi:hypothetical protein
MLKLQFFSFVEFVVIFRFHDAIVRIPLLSIERLK